MKRTASASWAGNLKKGKGFVGTASGILHQTPYSFTTRFEGEQGTNPEELIAAAHAGCFTMAMSAFLEKSGFTAEKLSTKATVNFEQIDDNWAITSIHLELVGKVPNIVPQMFEEIAGNAKVNCPVSRLFKANITLDAKLES